MEKMKVSSEYIYNCILHLEYISYFLKLTKSKIKCKEGKCVIMKGTKQEELMFLNICVPNIGVHKYTKQI